MNISEYIDYTLLRSTATEGEIIELCQKAIEYNYYSVCISSCHIPLAKQLLDGTGIKICTVVGFPLGNSSSQSKVFEAKKAIEDGAHEIDMVMNLGYLKSKNHLAVLRDISSVKSAIGNKPLKVIIEISELNKNEIVKACEICLDAKADFIKTSTGFSKSGATLTAVKIIKKTVKDKARIKASGGISDYETAIKYLEVGADRIGTSSAIKPLKNVRQIRNTKVFKKYIENSNNTNIDESSVNIDTQDAAKANS